MSELELVHAAIEDINSGSITWADLAVVLAQEPSTEPQEPSEAPLPRGITKAQSEALQRLLEVYATVVPTERRTLTPGEVFSLREERDVLDQIKKLTDTRREDVRQTVLNHFDVAAEQEGLVDEFTPGDKDGHYLIPAKEQVGDKVFTWEISEGDPKIDIDELKKHIAPEAYQAMTKEVRVFDEDLAMAYVKDHPEILKDVAAAVVPGKTRAAFNVRNVRSKNST